MELPRVGQVPIYACYCIDFRYDALSSEFLREIGFANSYFLATNAGAALPLGYDRSCKEIRPAGQKQQRCKDNTCCPGTQPMAELRTGFHTNLAIALTLKPITTVYLLNHQDCGAIRAFLPCSGYPASGKSDKDREICINAQVLTFARDNVHATSPHMQILLGLIDVNGTVANYDVCSQAWTIVHVGRGTDRTGLWFGHRLGDLVKPCCPPLACQQQQQPDCGDEDSTFRICCA